MIWDPDSSQFWNICDLLGQQTLHSVHGQEIRGSQETVQQQKRSFAASTNSWHKPEKQQHWGLSPAAPNSSHSWGPSMWSLSCSFFNPDLYQTGKRHSVLGQDLLICPCKEAADQVRESGLLPEPCQLTSCSKVNWIKKAQSRCTIWFSSFKFTLK